MSKSPSSWSHYLSFGIVEHKKEAPDCMKKDSDQQNSLQLGLGAPLHQSVVSLKRDYQMISAVIDSVHLATLRTEKQVFEIWIPSDSGAWLPDPQEALFLLCCFFQNEQGRSRVLEQKVRILISTFV